mgnify:FL=1
MGKYGVVFTPIKQPKREEIMETYKIKAIHVKSTHYEIELKANNEEDAYKIAEDKNISEWKEDVNATDPRFEYNLKLGDIEKI